MQHNKINYVTQPTEVSMGDDWFSSVSIEHFWIKRRFDLIKKLFSNKISKNITIGEVGCGTGLVQQQLENEYQVNTDGFDLNDLALQHNIATKQQLFCYDIYTKNEQFHKKYDVLLLMDVIEHIDDEAKFIDALMYMLKDGGYVLVNVPAYQTLYSIYDKQVGHVRRYNYKRLAAAFEPHGLKTDSWSYWGLGLVPVLLVRKFVLLFINKDNIVKKGISTGSNFMNSVLGIISKMEIIPQKFLGSSLFVVFKKG